VHASIRFDDAPVGTKLDPIRQDMSQEFIDRYAVASQDCNPVHIDPEWCSRARVFGTPKTVAHGMSTMSLMTSVVIRSWGATANIRRIQSKFTKPVEVGQTLTIKGVVREWHPIGPGRNFVVVEVRAEDRGGDLVGISEIEVALPG
jgi:acyl dehydratase